MNKKTFTAGALICRQVRALLDLNNIPFREYKGMFDSEFVVDVTFDQWNVLLEIIHANS